MRRSKRVFSRRQTRRAAVAILWSVVLLAPALGGLALTQIAGGLLSFASAQSVTGSSGWGGICPSAQQSGRCMWSSGLALAPSTGQILMTTTEATMGSYTHNYSLLFNSTSASVFSTLNLSCTAADPYYPGSGADFYIPCDPPNPSSNIGSILIVDLSTDQVVGQIPLKGFYTSWWAPEGLAWDSANGLLYACNNHLGALLALNTTAQSTVFNVTIPGGCAWVIYDSSSNDLVVSGASPFVGGGNGLRVVDPQSGQVTTTPFNTAVTAGAVDSAAGWMALGTALSGNALVGSVMFVNASTLEPISTTSLTAPYGTGFGVPIQMLLDPAHGDLYVVTAGNVFAINYTSRDVLADIGIATSGPGDFSSIYVPSTDSLYLPLEAVIVTVSLTHGSYVEISSILWLPVSGGTLVIAGLAGTVAAVAVYLRRSHGPKNARPPSP